MTNAATIEVYGPVDDVERAVLALPDVSGSVRNPQGALVVDLGTHAAIVGRDVEYIGVVIDGPESDACAGEVFEQLAEVLPYAMDLTDADASGIIRHRDAVDAA